jgi:hypothetical protein
VDVDCRATGFAVATDNAKDIVWVRRRKPFPRSFVVAPSRMQFSCNACLLSCVTPVAWRLQCGGSGRVGPVYEKITVGRNHGSFHISSLTSDRCWLGLTSRCSDDSPHGSIVRLNPQALRLRFGSHLRAGNLPFAPAPEESQDQGCQEVPIED